MAKFLLSLSLVACTAIVGVARADAPATSPTTQSSAATQPSPTTQSSPATTTVKRGSLSVAVDGQGAFDPIDPFEIRLRFKVYQGDLTLSSIARNGAAVKKGDVLLEIDPAPMKRAVAAAENDDLAAKATLDRAQVESRIGELNDVLALRQQQAALKEAQEQVKWFDNVDGPQYLKQNELAVQQARDQMNDQQDELDQLKKLYKSEELTNATADIVVKRAVRQLDQSKVGFTMMEQRADKNKSLNYPTFKQRIADSAEASQQQFELFQASQKQGKVLRQTSLATVTAATELADTRLADIKADAEKLTVRAPFDGVFCYGQIANGSWTAGDPRALRTGEHLTPSAVICTLYQPGRLRVFLDLPESKFFAISGGQKASVSPTAFPELKYDGMCEPGAHIANASGNYPLFVSMGEVDSKLAPGMKAQVHLDAPLVDNVLLAPTTAIKDGAASVKVGDNFESRHVFTGRSDGKMIEILSGLRESDEVLTQAK